LTRLIDEAILTLRIFQEEMINWKKWDHRDSWSWRSKRLWKWNEEERIKRIEKSKTENQWQERSTNHLLRKYFTLEVEFSFFLFFF
jgi:hypothetical protein